MFAVIQTGGKQYKVASNDTVLVEKLEGKAGDIVTLDVVAIGNGKDVSLGAPLVSGAKVTAEIIGVEKGDKVLIFKKKRRQNYRRTNGHRQQFTKLFITGIADANGNSTKANEKRKPALKAPTATPAKEKTAGKAPKAAPVKKAAAQKPAAKKATPKAETAEKPAAEKKPAAKKPAAPKAETAEKKPAAKKPAAKKNAE